MKMKILALASGGMDSTIMLYHYKNNIKNVMFIDYGSKHNGMELEYLINTCKRLDLPIILINVRSAFTELAYSSSLMRNGNALPKKLPANHPEQSKTVVPFRNGIFISIAVAHAQSNNLGTVLIGATKSDSDIYADCRQGFIVNMNNAIADGTDRKVSLFAPYLVHSKKELAVIGESFKFDGLNLDEDTYSCYEGGKIHCGVCGACVARKEALSLIEDTTKYLE